MNFKTLAVFIILSASVSQDVNGAPVFKRLKNYVRKELDDLYEIRHGIHPNMLRERERLARDARQNPVPLFPTAAGPADTLPSFDESHSSSTSSSQQVEEQKVSRLQTMFPSLAFVVQDVLEANDWNDEKAIDQLLSMDEVPVNPSSPSDELPTFEQAVQSHVQQEAPFTKATSFDEAVNSDPLPSFNPISSEQVPSFDQAISTSKSPVIDKPVVAVTHESSSEHISSTSRSILQQIAEPVPNDVTATEAPTLSLLTSTISSKIPQQTAESVPATEAPTLSLLTSTISSAIPQQTAESVPATEARNIVMNANDDGSKSDEEYYSDDGESDEEYYSDDGESDEEYFSYDEED